jgi:hypothetical protein
VRKVFGTILLNKGVNTIGGAILAAVMATIATTCGSRSASQENNAGKPPYVGGFLCHALGYPLSTWPKWLHSTVMVVT